MSYQKIYLGTECRSAEEPLPGEQRDNDINGEPVEPPKVWDFKDPFVFAPPKPDRDPWSILLEPLMEKDRIQCEAWKDEVQNLLIFAGLFSAVVTAFIIESYKSLKPDPNDAIISLLSVIANRLDNTANSTLVLPTSMAGPSFSPNMSSIRVNTFWFISLVLSLATVLVGIISLQWIREHQTYPKLSPKETYALFNMRAEGLESWQIPKIFTALPLLLQSALVLFLSGIMDFLSSFGGIVVIPVGTVTALILLFLIATTVLPGLQGSLLFLPYPYLRSRKTPPAPCPYKSPQAHAFRSVLRSIIRIGSRILPGRQLWRKTHRFATYIGLTWTGQRWAEFDMAWLRLRDAFARRSCGRLFEEHYYFEDVPMYDLACGLMASVQSRDIDLVQNSLSAQYNCFNEISQWTTTDSPELVTMREDSHLLQTRAYLRNLMVTDRAALSHFFRSDALGDSHLETQRENETGLAKILHYENLFFFLRFLRKYRGFEELFDHKLELTTRLSAIAHKEEYGHYATSQNSAWTDIQAEYNVVPFYFAGKGNDRHIFIFQWVNNFLMFFQGVARIQPPYTFGGTFYTHPLIFDYVTVSTRIDLHKVFELNEGLGPAIQKKFSEIIQFLTDDLMRQISSPNFREPNLLFYITALYLHATRRPFHHSLYGLLSAMRAYKQRTIDLGMASPIIEESYGRNLDPYDIRFSRKWWDFLKYPRVRDRSVSNASRDPNIVETGGPPSRHG